MTEFAIPPTSAEKPPKEWRCFHCDEVFADREEAAIHFGIQIDGLADEVACKLAEDQKGLVAMLRDQQRELDTYHTEDNASYREFHALGAKHSTELREAQQAGYDKGLADGHATPFASATVDDVAGAIYNAHKFTDFLSPEGKEHEWDEAPQYAKDVTLKRAHAVMALISGKA